MHCTHKVTQRNVQRNGKKQIDIFSYQFQLECVESELCLPSNECENEIKFMITDQI